MNQYAETTTVVQTDTGYKVITEYTYDDDILWLLKTIRMLPGASRQELERSAVVDGFKFTTQELTNLILRVRRNLGLIENRGTRQYPQWYIK